MLLLLAKYAVLWSISINLCDNREDCNKVAHTDKLEEYGFYQVAACTARCLRSNETVEFTECANSCSNATQYESMVHGNESNSIVQLVCRNQSAIVLKVGPISGSQSDAGIVSDMYIIKIYEHASPEEVDVYLSNDTFFQLNNLKNATTYNISIVAIKPNNEYATIANCTQYTTLEPRFIPRQIHKINDVNKFFASNETGLLNAFITWEPSYDRSCDYNIVFYASHAEMADFKEINVFDPKRLYSEELQSLTFGVEYAVGIRSYNRYAQKESALVWKYFNTPECLDWYSNNLNMCSPDPPTNLTVYDTEISRNEMAMNITWDKPTLEPDYYKIRILDLDQLHLTDSNSIVLNVSKEQNHLFIPSIHLNGQMYEVHLTAYSPGGNSTVMSAHHIVRKAEGDDPTFFRLTTAILAPMICIGIMALVVSIICHRRLKLKRYEERCRYFEEMEKKTPFDLNCTYKFPEKNKSLLIRMDAQGTMDDNIDKFKIDDNMEIDTCNLELYEVLGEGAFGLVRRGILSSEENSSQEVAVKMLKDKAGNDDIRAFRREIDVMKSVGNHPNIVGIIGHYTKDYNNMLLLTEYCSLGNLLDFLRSEWNYMLELKTNLKKVHSSSTPTLAAKQDENPLNLDTSLIEKISLKYKNINVSLVETAQTPTMATYNKAYGYEDLCTNACRCQVELIKDDKNKVKIQNCECKLKASSIQGRLDANKGAHYRNLSLSSQDISMDDSSRCQRQPLSSADLLQIALQISSGMEFLAKNKVVHRDLAARNVLVCQNRTVKIADFGLSRDIYQENVYKKTGNGKLPIKWLAIESMTHQVYTTRSDVWAFGILLYEIVTLGGTPYPSIPTNRLLHLLKTGYRMEKPKNCGVQLYSLMNSCWHANPSERPNFADIHRILNIFLAESSDEQIMNLITPVNRAQKPSTYEPYLKPL